MKTRSLLVTVLVTFHALLPFNSTEKTLTRNNLKLMLMLGYSSFPDFKENSYIKPPTLEKKQCYQARQTAFQIPSLLHPLYVVEIVLNNV